MFENPETLVIVPIITAAVQYLKKIPVFKRPAAKEWLPFLSCIIGIAAGFIYYFLIGDGVVDWTDALLHGFLYGMTACGFYGFTQCTFKKSKMVNEGNDRVGRE